MNYLIVGSHPYEGSFIAAVTKNIQNILKTKNHSVVHIDLVSDGFNPVMQSEDLRLWGQGQTRDTLVKKYQAEIEKAHIIVFPFPVWWGTAPAVLKGFCDKVLLPSWAYNINDKAELIGLLKGKKAIVITSMQTPIAIFNEYFNNPVEGAFIKDTLEKCGMEVLHHFVVPEILTGGKEYTTAKMNEIIEYFKN